MDEFDIAFENWMAGNFEEYKLASWPLRDALKAAYLGGITEGLKQSNDVMFEQVG